MMYAVASQGHKSDPMNFQLLTDSIPALIPTTPPDGYLNPFNQIWLGYVGVSLGDLQGWKWTVAIHPEEVAGSRSLRLVYPGIAQIVDIAIK
jgi:PAS domain-containing protein